MEIVFGRLVEHDERNFSFALKTAALKERSYTYPLPEPLDLNQGSVGMCVSTAIGYDLALSPVFVRDITIPKLKEKIYYEAQKIDPFPGGDYPGANPKKAGTSVLAGIKVTQALGYFTEYRWVFNAYDLALGVGSVSPAVIGVNWYSGMMQPDQNYQIHPTGTIVGGHAICVRGVNFKKKLFVLQNSWGAHWGANGCCLMSFANMDMLLKQNGDAVFTVNRNKKLLTF
jgi:hypothetical protein